MSKQATRYSLALAMGTVFSVSLANIAVANAADNPFSMQAVSGERVMMAEGKCGMARMDADGDGKVTKQEFMQGHDAMFDKIDGNGDGVIDTAERDTHMKKMMQRLKQGKCGEGKCGGAE